MVVKNKLIALRLGMAPYGLSIKLKRAAMGLPFIVTTGDWG